MTSKKYWIILSFLIATRTTAQHYFSNIPDSVANKNYTYLAHRIATTNKHEISKLEIYCRAYLLKARLERNWAELCTGYKNMMYITKEELKLSYADSMIFAARKSNDNALIGSSYLTKGNVFHNIKKSVEALDNYIAANEFISATDDSYLKYKIKYSIAYIKYNLGYFEEATGLFNECVDFFKIENDRAYLNSIHALGLCYNKTNQYTESARLNNLGLTESKRLNSTEMVAYFNQSNAINDYFEKNYSNCINGLLRVQPEITLKNDFANETVGNFYIGKSYWALQKKEKAIPYFLKVHDAFVKHEFILPELRENYELLIKYYQDNNNIKCQLKYINQLLKVDSVLYKNFAYLSSRIHKEYDTKLLLQNRKTIEDELTIRKYFEMLLVLIIVILLAISVRFCNRKKHYKRKFKILMEQPIVQPEKEIKVSVEETSKVLDINPEVVASILKQLDKFETKRRFLDSELTITKLSSQFDSNVKYVSKVISYYKHKKYINYVNDLRIDYIIELIKTENKYRNYTHTALAEEAGFKTGQHFTNAFISRTGITVTYFIKQIKKSDSTGDLD